MKANQRLSVFRCMKYRTTNSALMNDSDSRSHGTQVSAEIEHRQFHQREDRQGQEHQQVFRVLVFFDRLVFFHDNPAVLADYSR